MVEEDVDAGARGQRGQALEQGERIVVTLVLAYLTAAPGDAGTRATALPP